MNKRRIKIARSDAPWISWEIITEEGKQIAEHVNKESDLFVSKIDTLIATITERKAA